jgi:hypothetical protein
MGVKPSGRLPPQQQPAQSQPFRPYKREVSFKALPLAAQLLLAFVGVVVGATVTLTVSAYRSTLENLEQDAARTAELTAQNRERLLTQALAGRQQRARSLLVTVESACTEVTMQGRLAFAPDCVAPILRDFRTDEGALGVVLTNRGRRVATSGAPVAEQALAPQANAATTSSASATAISGC